MEHPQWVAPIWKTAVVLWSCFHYVILGKQRDLNRSELFVNGSSLLVPIFARLPTSKVSESNKNNMQFETEVRNLNHPRTSTSLCWMSKLCIWYISLRVTLSCKSFFDNATYWSICFAWWSLSWDYRHCHWHLQWWEKASKHLADPTQKAHLEFFVEISDLTQIIQELVNDFLLILDKRI